MPSMRENVRSLSDRPPLPHLTRSPAFGSALDTCCHSAAGPAQAPPLLPPHTCCHSLARTLVLSLTRVLSQQKAPLPPTDTLPAACYRPMDAALLLALGLLAQVRPGTARGSLAPVLSAASQSGAARPQVSGTAGSGLPWAAVS